MKNIHILCICAMLFIMIGMDARAQKRQGTLSFTVTMSNPASHIFHVHLRCEKMNSDTIQFYMPAWSPGYYQLLQYAKNVEQFTVTGDNNQSIPWESTPSAGWKVITKGVSNFNIDYNVKATAQFVAQSFLDETHGYIIPAGMFIYIDGQLDRPSTVHIEPYPGWTDVATGLDTLPGKPNHFTAANFDILYDCPMLIGNLESLPSFTVKGIPHRFIGYQMGKFDRVQFMADLRKIVEGASGIIGDIPYNRYTFLAIGPGRGGIEHLNSTTISFDGSQMNTHEGKVRMYNFIAHEYFHHYNVKRIRPIELGPFDYQKGSPTRSLWVSEGLSVYYEYLVVKRMGLMTRDELLDALRNNLMNYENKPGHLYQSVAEASYSTWSDGPFGRTGDEVNKTISYYDKGPVLGMLLDFRIRSQTGNKHSLDDVMRYLYTQYYQKKKRGFTEDELRSACEKIAGSDLSDFFVYINTVQDIDYPRYFNYAGLQVDTTTKELPGAWLGITTRDRNDTLLITAVDWNSPAWVAGLRAGDKLMSADGSKVNKAALESLVGNKNTGDPISLSILHENDSRTLDITLGKKTEKKFIITPVAEPNELQKQILRSWLNE